MAGAHQAGAMSAGRRSDARSAPARSAETLATIQSKPLPGTALCMVLVGAAIFLGGGGTVNPQTEMILQVLTATLMIPLFVSARWQRGLGQVPPAMQLLAILLLLLPVLHLVPLPPSIWQALPGRGIERQALALVGADTGWMPLSMAPARTFASLLAMICPVLLMLQVSRLSHRGRNWLCITIVAAGIVSLLLGVLQLSHTAGWNWSPYSQVSEGYLIGFQANHNAQADFLMVAILALGVVVTTRLGDGRHHALTWAVFLFLFLALLVGLLMTGSRTGIALGLPTLVVLGLMFLPGLRNRKAASLWLGGIVGAAIIGTAALTQLQSVQKVADRFSLTKEARWDLWADTWFAVQQVWPFGSGIGTIVPMLEAAERLDVVDTTRPVRAHNDWLEWILEGGLPGLVILGLIVILLGVVAARGLIASARSGTAAGHRAQVLFGCGVVMIVALHSFMDYPLRSMAIAALTGVAVAFLGEPAATQRNKA
jgi:O-antigen ligase